MPKTFLIKISCLILIFSNNVNTDRIYNIVALGTIGVGKTSLLNMFAKGNLSFNFNETIYEYQGIKLRLIDTYGLNENYEKDARNIELMVREIQGLERVDLFLLCLDGSNTRLADYTTASIDIYKQIFPEFLRHMVVIFNKWTLPNLSHMLQIKNEYEILFVKKFGHHNLECFFIGKLFKSFYYK
jgi:tRNA U34 5-carboxymethylaminomethyl modifying GTPase MnmE/TrmE